MDLASALTDILKTQVSHVARVTRAIVTEDDVARHMPTARAIHQQNRERAYQADEAENPDLREWACRSIAVNLVARERGFDVARIQSNPSSQRDTTTLDLRPHVRIDRGY